MHVWKSKAQRFPKSGLSRNRGPEGWRKHWACQKQHHTVNWPFRGSQNWNWGPDLKVHEGAKWGEREINSDKNWSSGAPIGNQIVQPL